MNKTNALKPFSVPVISLPIMLLSKPKLTANRIQVEELLIWTSINNALNYLLNNEFDQIVFVCFTWWLRTTALINDCS